MSTWRVAQHYGFGAARIPIRPEPHRVVSSGLRAGFADMRAEFVDGGIGAMVRRTLAQSPAILLGLLLLAAFLVTTLRDHSDVSPIEIVMFEDAPPPIQEMPEPTPEPVPEPVPLAVEPPKPVPKPVAPELPPPVVVAEKPKPPPPPKIERPKPKPKPPVMPKIARIEKPRPPPPVRPERMQRVEPKPPAPARPRIELSAVAPTPSSKPPLPVTRTQRVASHKPKVARPDAPQLDAPKSPSLSVPSEAPPPRSFRVAATADAPRVRGPRVTPGLAPSPQAPAAPVPKNARRVRSDRSQSPTKTRRPAVAPELASVPTAGPAETGPRPTRRDPRPTPQAQRRRSPRPNAELARAPVALPDSGVPTAAARVAREAIPGSPRGESAPLPGLAGVPLADLAVCMSDREEDRLKQAVVAAVTTQKECVSRAGTYRFVETKNLNSFLMWIDRASGQSVGDRCDELRHALECLQSASQRAAR